MELSYDKKSDAVYIRVSSALFAYTRSLDDLRHLDYAEDDSLIGIEILYPGQGVKVDDLPHQAQVGRLLEEHGFKVLASSAS
ncbi:MAG: DUF2283 domain-containing protein [Chloroflexi bacterium]|nr:DUF2283 domain-containing protein [Chloroflexota bacterium]